MHIRILGGINLIYVVDCLVWGINFAIISTQIFEIAASQIIAIQRFLEDISALIKEIHALKFLLDW